MVGGAIGETAEGGQGHCAVLDCSSIVQLKGWKMRALIVDDDVVGRRLLEKYLSTYAECDLAEDGLDAIRAFIVARTENRPYDLICLDIMMPLMDGQEALRRIRQLEDKLSVAERNRVKIIMTTSYADREHIMRAAVDKCSGYLVKPIEKVLLLNRLKSVGLLIENAENV
jgi:two-component system, chemotaxis family, chemotaxis protein CheY